MNIEPLKQNFVGTGEVKGFVFDLIKETDLGFIYKITTSSNKSHYEITKKDLAAKSLDFKNRIFSTTDFKYTMPRSYNFGLLCWTAITMDRAIEILNSLEKQPE